MKKQKYVKPSMEVFELSEQPQLLAGSNGQAGVQDYDWQTGEDE